MPRSVQEVCTLGYGVEKRPSGIAGAGDGLYATQAFSKNQYITFYDGERISRTEALKRRANGKDSHIRSTGLFMDCIDGFTGSSIYLGCGAASLVNDGRSSTINNCKLINDSTGNTYLKALRDISLGEELLYSYGRNYWRLM
jgi:SET domain-containing protein